MVLVHSGLKEVDIHVSRVSINHRRHRSSGTRILSKTHTATRWLNGLRRHSVFRTGRCRHTPWMMLRSEIIELATPAWIIRPCRIIPRHLCEHTPILLNVRSSNRATMKHESTLVILEPHLDRCAIWNRLVPCNNLNGSRRRRQRPSSGSKVTLVSL